ncbi:MAG: DUF4446 family protein [Chloroflexi bacterium]|nr:DUF4446 family protein [Chloroflexota bacterium]
MPNGNAITLSALALSGFLFLWVVFLSVRVRQLGVKHKTLKTLSKSGDVGDAIDELYRYYSAMNKGLGEAREAQRALGKGLHGAVQGVGVVRFDAFDDMAGGLSFAVALLDANGGGVVLSTINGRRDSRSYAKPVESGRSSYELSDEEIQAIRLAMR